MKKKSVWCIILGYGLMTLEIERLRASTFNTFPSKHTLPSVMPAANKTQISQHQTVFQTPEENLLNWKQIWVMRWERERNASFHIVLKAMMEWNQWGCSLPMRPMLSVFHHSVGECIKALLNESKVKISGRLVSLDCMHIYPAVMDDKRRDELSPMKWFNFWHCLLCLWVK